MRKHRLLAWALGGLALTGFSPAAVAETMQQALAQAYSSNPSINSQRAQTRSDDENVPIARAGNRPTVSAFADITGTRNSVRNVVGDRLTGDAALGLTISQDIFTGFRVRNAIRQSQAGVLASRDLLRNTVQNTLFDASQAYMDVVRDIQILQFRNQNVTFLQEQVRAAGERFNVGETTRTDVAQTRARLAAARADLALAGSNLATSRATYRQIIGRDASGLRGGFPYSRLVPRRLEQAIALGQNGHPVILASINQADAQAFVVKQIEGEVLPTVSIEGTLQRNESLNYDLATSDPTTASITGRLSVPIYQGGAVSARIRQAKEQYGLRKIEVDVARDQVRAAVVTAWAQVEASRSAIVAAREGVDAAGIALSGVQEEQRVGQRTTLDVLDQQQEFLNAQETLIIAERDLVVASFALLSAMGRLSAQDLRLATAVYDPAEHYVAVKDKWRGFRTPDGR